MIAFRTLISLGTRDFSFLHLYRSGCLMAIGRNRLDPCVLRREGDQSLFWCVLGDALGRSWRFHRLGPLDPQNQPSGVSISHGGRLHHQSELRSKGRKRQGCSLPAGTENVRDADRDQTLFAFSRRDDSPVNLDTPPCQWSR